MIQLVKQFTNAKIAMLMNLWFSLGKGYYIATALKQEYALQTKATPQQCSKRLNGVHSRFSLPGSW